MRFTLQYSLFLVVTCFFFSREAKAQTIFYEDIFYGGVTGDGYNPFVLENPGSLDIYIEPSSTIRKAFLFVTAEKTSTLELEDALNNTFSFNGTILSLNWYNPASGIYQDDLSGPSTFDHATLVFDVTELVDPSIGSYSLIPAQNQIPTAVEGVYYNYYLFVSYENPMLPIVGTQIILNEQDAQQTLAFDIGLNADLNYNIGFTFNSEAFCNTTWDGSYIFVNGTNIGLTGGNEPEDVHICTGVRGSFYYQNNQLFGLGNDTPTPLMSGTDALASIETYVSDPTDITIEFEYQTPGGNGDKTNPVHQLFLTYTTPCDTFSVSVPNDTTLCYGETLQLPSINSGTAYEWLPSTGLSCSDCPDPIFTADSSMFYTVRIWNNDSCSVVRPLKINVSRTQIDSLDVSPPDCGASNGSIVVYAHNTLNEVLFYSVNGSPWQQVPDTEPVEVTGLAEGTYTISVQDAMGCPVVDSTVVLNDVNNTVSQFALNPTVGNVPIEIDVYNQSQNATEYEWYINGVYAGDNLGGYTIENGGEYVFELVAWQYDPSCADTFSVLVWASEVIIPTAFTPNNDGDNDVWEIVNLDAHFPKNKVKVFNRWGNLLFESNEGNYATNPWDGTYNGEPVPVGSYYFIIETHVEGVDDFKGTVTVVRE